MRFEPQSSIVLVKIGENNAVVRGAARFFVRSYSTWFLRCFLSKFSILAVLFIVRVNVAVCFSLSVQCVPSFMVGS